MSSVQGPGLFPDNNDVTAWQQGEWCYALRGTRGTPGEGDTQNLFRSRDLGSWEYMHRFYESERRWTDGKDDCSCPDFFEIGSRWMLLHFCHQRPSGTRYYLGRFEQDRFYPEAFDRINWPGGNIHAPRTMLDEKGRRILLFANLNEGRDMSVCIESGWYGVMSLPVVISPAPDGSEETLVSFSTEPPTIHIDFCRASLRDDLTYQQDPRVQAAPFDFKQGERITLRVFLDHSVLEVFAGDQRYMAQRIYPTHPDTGRISHHDPRCAAQGTATVQDGGVRVARSSIGCRI